MRFPDNEQSVLVAFFDVYPTACKAEFNSFELFVKPFFQHGKTVANSTPKLLTERMEFNLLKRGATLKQSQTLERKCLAIRKLGAV